MAVHSCTAAQLPALFKQLETARLQRVQEALFEAAQAGVPIIAKAAPVDQGETRRSVHAERMGIEASRILVDSPIAGVVELGSRPHWAPLAPLVAWVARHQKFFRSGWRLQRKIKRGIARAEKQLKHQLSQTERLAAQHLKSAGMALTRRRRFGFGLTKHDVFMAHASRGKALMARSRSLRQEIRRNRGRGR
jgi:glycine/D-amino acid oxidase-like deaminating enzyme